jgi:hypothetical protein
MLVQRTTDAGIAAEAGLSECRRGGANASEKCSGDNEGFQKRRHGKCPHIRFGLFRMNQPTMQGGSFMP